MAHLKIKCLQHIINIPLKDVRLKLIICPRGAEVLEHVRVGNFYATARLEFEQPNFFQIPVQEC